MKNILSRALEVHHGRILPNFFEKRGFNHQFEVSITSKDFARISHTLLPSCCFCAVVVVFVEINDGQQQTKE